MNITFDFAEYYAEVTGWIDRHIMTDILDAIDEFQYANNVSGGVMEIGVHHGKFFIPIHNKTRGDECSYAVDLFAMQDFNIDRSGSGNLEIFKKNLYKYGKDHEKCIIVEADSTIWDYEEIIKSDNSINRKLRIISIDGSHTMNATVIDLLQCEKILAGGGVIFVDDYTNVHWPGVACGVSKYFLLYEPRVCPFFLGLNKLILCHTTWHKKYFNLIKSLTDNNSSRKLVEMHGHHLISAREWK